MTLIHPPRLECRFPRLCLLPSRGWPTEGQDSFQRYISADAWALLARARTALLGLARISIVGAARLGIAIT
jgi:hypothetical protein